MLGVEDPGNVSVMEACGLVRDGRQCFGSGGVWVVLVMEACRLFR